MGAQMDREEDIAQAGKPTRPWWGRPWVAAAAAAGVIVAAVVLVWFQPQKLLIDERVDQDVPTAEPAPAEIGAAGGAGGPAEATAPGAPAEPAGPVDLRTGEFVARDHATSGTVRVLELADGRRFVRFEGFSTDNGPALYVYLSPNPAGGPEEAFDQGHVELGRLQGNVGDQNYELPADVNPEAFASVVVWCDRFDSAFGAADLAPA